MEAKVVGGLICRRNDDDLICSCAYKNIHMTIVDYTCTVAHDGPMVCDY